MPLALSYPGGRHGVASESTLKANAYRVAALFVRSQLSHLLSTCRDNMGMSLSTRRGIFYCLQLLFCSAI
jgi:hypothetical protein